MGEREEGRGRDRKGDRVGEKGLRGREKKIVARSACALLEAHERFYCI